MTPADLLVASMVVEPFNPQMCTGIGGARTRDRVCRTIYYHNLKFNRHNDLGTRRVNNHVYLLKYCQISNLISKIVTVKTKVFLFFSKLF